jgi:PAS domain S-box-containing protein
MDGRGTARLLLGIERIVPEKHHFAIYDTESFYALGKAETLARHSQGFIPVDLKIRIFVGAVIMTGNPKVPEMPVMPGDEALRPPSRAVGLEAPAFDEKLEATNTKLALRTADLNDASVFQQSILTSLRLGIAVIGEDMLVSVWNVGAVDLWGVTAKEALGRSLLDLDIGLPVSQLPVKKVLAGETSHEEVVVEATNRRGRPIHCRVTCSQFASPEDTRLGVVILMEEVTDPHTHTPRTECAGRQTTEQRRDSIPAVPPFAILHPSSPPPNPCRSGQYYYACCAALLAMRRPAGKWTTIDH